MKCKQNKTCFPTYHFYLQVTIPVLLYNLYNKVRWGELYCFVKTKLKTTDSDAFRIDQ